MLKCNLATLSIEARGDITQACLSDGMVRQVVQSNGDRPTPLC